MLVKHTEILLLVLFFIAE